MDVVQIMKEAKRPLILTGALFKDFDLAIELSEALNAHIAATGNSIAGFRDRGFENASKEWISEIVNWVCIPEWKGLDGKGKPDLLIFMGYHPYLLKRMLSTLSNFSECRTVVLEKENLEKAVKYIKEEGE